MLDLPGLDGTKASKDATLQELLAADMVIWVLRANRPAREIDRDVLQEFRGYFAENPARRRPPVFPVLTCVDTLVDGWPYPENLLPPQALAKIATMVAEVADAVSTTHPIPLVLTRPEWNVESLRTSVEAAMAEALMVQRNRARVLNADTRATAEIARAGRGLVRGLSLFGTRNRDDEG